MLSSLALVGVNSNQTWPYFVGLGCVASHLAWQVKLPLILLGCLGAHCMTRPNNGCEEDFYHSSVLPKSKLIDPCRLKPGLLYLNLMHCDFHEGNGCTMRDKTMKERNESHSYATHECFPSLRAHSTTSYMYAGYIFWADFNRFHEIFFSD